MWRRGPVALDGGSFLGEQVPLGELMTDALRWSGGGRTRHLVEAAVTIEQLVVAVAPRLPVLGD